MYFDSTQVSVVIVGQSVIQSFLLVWIEKMEDGPWAYGVRKEYQLR